MMSWLKSTTNGELRRLSTEVNEDKAMVQIFS